MDRRGKPQSTRVWLGAPILQLFLEHSWGVARLIPWSHPWTSIGPWRFRMLPPPLDFGDLGQRDRTLYLHSRGRNQGGWQRRGGVTSFDRIKDWLKVEQFVLFLFAISWIHGLDLHGLLVYYLDQGWSSVPASTGKGGQCSAAANSWTWTAVNMFAFPANSHHKKDVHDRLTAPEEVSLKR